MRTDLHGFAYICADPRQNLFLSADRGLGVWRRRVFHSDAEMLSCILSLPARPLT